MTAKKKKRTPADVIRHPVDGPKTIQQRISYLNMPEVQRSMAIERAERQEPIDDKPRPKSFRGITSNKRNA